MGKKLRVTIGVALVLAGSCYFLYPNFREWQTQHEVNTIIQEFEDNKEKVLESSVDDVGDNTVDNDEVKKDSDDAVKDVKDTVLPELYESLLTYNSNLLSGQQILDAWSYEQSPADVKLLNNGSDVIGYIEIPDMKNLRLPLYLGASTENLEKGAAVLSQTSMPIGGESTNCVIAAHRGFQGSAFFQHIDKLHTGSMIYITNPWETLEYKVVGAKIVQPTQTNDIRIQRGKDMVTLISCHPYVIGGGPERYLVFCERVKSSSNSNDISEQSSESVTSKDNELQIDSSDMIDIDSVEENDLQKLENYLRIMLPLLILFIICIILLLHRIHNRNK